MGVPIAHNRGHYIGTDPKDHIDVEVTAPIDEEILAFDEATLKWINKPGGGGGGTPSDTVVEETAFGQSSSAGSATTYSRGNHTHGTPVDPVPAHALLPDVHHPQAHTLASHSTKSHDELTEKGINTHEDIDFHIGDTDNPHGTTKAQVGLSNVTNEAQIAKSIGIDKGDIITFTGAGAPVKRGVGLDGQVLTADAVEADGVKWATPVAAYRGYFPMGW